MVIIKSRSPLQHGVDILLTMLGWAAFAYLFIAGTFAMLAENPGDQAWLPAQLFSTLATLRDYTALTLAGALLLLVWAKYNQYRFRGKDRRKSEALLSEAKLLASFKISSAQLSVLQQARTSVIRHDEHGNILGVDAAVP